MKKSAKSEADISEVSLVRFKISGQNSEKSAANLNALFSLPNLADQLNYAREGEREREVKI